MNDIGIDISKIPLETLKKGYHDYRLIQQAIEFCDDTNREIKFQKNLLKNRFYIWRNQIFLVSLHKRK